MGFNEIILPLGVIFFMLVAGCFIK